MKYGVWNIKGFDRPAAVKLCRSGLNPLVSVFLASRGITERADADKMLNSDLSQICDPFLMSGMNEAVLRLEKAIENKEHVAVFGDYDVDGMTASCLIADYFRSRGLTCEIYIPGRMDEGYGINVCALDHLSGLGVTLIVTVDCGVTAIEETEYARSLGIDLIITDHHECKDVLPNAVTVIDPKRRDCGYPFKSLAGVGVAFKLLCALDGEDNTEALLDRYGDFVAIGTLADVMPVTGENRVLIRRGLEKISKDPRPGLKALIEASGFGGKQINSGCVGFTLAPRLNAAGRMGCAYNSVRLMLSETLEEATVHTEKLLELNAQRRDLETQIYSEAREMLDGSPISAPIVLSSDRWHQGIIGIVASRLAERFCVPVIMICIENGIGRGSCRCHSGFNLFSALEHCGDLLENYGGHAMAAGLTIKESNIPALRQRLAEYYKMHVDSVPVRTLDIDFEVIKPELLSLQNVTALAAMEPFGNGNALPVLCIRKAFLDSVTSIGGGKHSKLRLSMRGEYFDCVCFSSSPEELGAHSGCTVDLAFSPKINEFRGNRSVQLLLKDICVSEG